MVARTYQTRFLLDESGSLDDRFALRRVDPPLVEIGSQASRTLDPEDAQDLKARTLGLVRDRRRIVEVPDLPKTGVDILVSQAVE
jgi:hypothetical protein